MSQQTLACPECGNDGTEEGGGGIYARADIRWDGTAWTIGDVEDELDCTACDHAWSASDAGVDLPTLEAA